MVNVEYLRQFRVGGYAIFDFAVSFLGIFLLSPVLSKLFRYLNIDIPKINWLFFTLPVSILIHMLVGNYTPMTKQFLDPSGYYLLKIIMIGLFVLGLNGIKMIK